MKVNRSKIRALVFVLAIMVSFGWSQSVKVAKAATPTFKESQVEIVGEGETYQLVIQDKVSGSTYKWSSSKKSVAKISSKGVITTVNKGTAKISCKITYPTGKSKKITSTVNVTIPATKVKINNATEVNGAHILQIGEKYNFNRDITPSNSSDKTYWSIGGGDSECIQINNSANGTVTAKKPGKVILKATAAKKATAAEAAKSIVDDAIIIEVVGLSATVGNVSFVDANQLNVVFDSPIDASTILGANKQLLDTIQVTMKKDTKGVLADDPGKLTGQLSADSKTLTITSEHVFRGEYGVNFTKGIKTKDGVEVVEYYKQLSYIDTTPPKIVEFSVDDTGMFGQIRFNEPIDFSDFKVSKASVAYASGSVAPADPFTISILSNKLNYIVSEDKRSLSINLSTIAPTDFGKLFEVIISGVKDMAGNIPEDYTLTAYMYLDNTKKPQARPISVVRSSYDTLTATFDRAIQVPGYALVNGSGWNSGIVDTDNNKKVHYTITEPEVSLTGLQKVSLYLWEGYNVIETDQTSQRMWDFKNVNFSVDRTSPMLMTTEYDSTSNVLTLTYNKAVTLAKEKGVLTTTLVTITDDMLSGTMVEYTGLPSEDEKQIKLSMKNMTVYGDYIFTLPKGFALDHFRNESLGSGTIKVSNYTTTELPGPYAITQSATNPSQLYLEFANKLDIASAENINNYSIPGVTLLNAKVTKNTTETGATVVLTVAEGSISVTVERPVTIRGIKDYSGKYSPIEEATKLVELKDNMKPKYLSAKFDKNTMRTILLNFDEAVSGTAVFKVTQIVGSTSIPISNSVETAGNNVIITLDDYPELNTYLRVEVVENRITDLSGNTSTIPPTMGVVASY